MIRKFALALLFVHAALGATACRASPAQDASVAVDRARGVYVILGPGETNPQARPVGFSGPNSGIYLRLGWETLQPAADRFNWAPIDAVMAAARRGNKRVSISIRAGRYTPSWLIGRVKSGEFTVGRNRGRAGACSTFRVAAPWDRDYLAAYDRMMKALAEHLRATGAYGSVSIVKVTGINRQTDELRLPSARPQEDAVTAGEACAISDAPATWKQLGYRPGLVVAAWKTLARSVDTAFPDKLLAIEIVGHDFPPIDQSGNVTSRRSAAPAEVRRQIIRAGVQMFPGRFAVQRDGLNDRRVSPELARARQEGAIIGLQSNLRQGPRKGRGAGCNLSRDGDRKKADPCTQESYRALLAKAKDAGAVYVEVWAVDVTRFGTAITDAERTF